MSTDRVRVGVIGVGRMGERHCRIYSGLSNVHFAGISDVSEQRGREVADRYGVRYFPDFFDLLGFVDAVSIATPTPLHFPVAVECLRQQVHVLVEKPVASDLNEARELAFLARRTPALLQVGHIERFNPAFLELQSVVEDMEVIALSARRLSPFDTSNTDVDVVFDLMIHDIDLALTLAGDGIESVQACSRAARMDTADHVVALLSMSRGPLVSLTASRVTEQKVRQLEITALDAYIDVDLLSKSIAIYRRTLPEYISNHQRPLRYRQENFVERIQIPTAEPLLLEIQDFVRCVREGAKPKVPGEAGLRALELATQIRNCVGTGSLREDAVLAAG